ncbi:MAG: exopolysaccharide biosynthesis polyprenyl glycosylphosphotransferase [Fermentimonas sp.]|jgi:putative colanic acid biosynthesis UDP-glucose lipid carrier transferase|nr:exopolysaccharide biosynthesis polyprenyl glycosylphosphotransferase [Fermentimonas sp.]NLC87111.1 exopolysaccharide biosynthesis polyprenyl glycosylphosphotransferase [Bacteroidales bacterium]HBT86671.1 undecaprenyl-phosphate glucose phosphotransferase [Porphyromonadaceae bacterium]MDD2931553.1 exopolysaccharide biosynthesis polyprenyl glycosylphosphotransferase [Fermentimonas sp.]MDD3188711.1 exopolysaccharide biosynthesis polyprenyl glycosylphosphotransferase [Fermentimonas sp.]
MEPDNSGVKVFYLFFDLLLLNIAVFTVFYFSPMRDYLDLTLRNTYFLHANISEIIAYTLYSKRNYFFTDKFSDRLRITTIRFLVLLLALFVLAEVFLPDGYYKGFLLEYTAIFYIIKVVVFYFIYKTQQFRFKNGYAHFRVAILGLDNPSRVLGKLIQNNPSLGYNFVGFISDTEKSDNEQMIQEKKSKKKSIGKLSDLRQFSDKYRINMILVTNPKYFTKENTKELLSICNETGLRLRYVLTNGYWNKHVFKRKESSRFFEMFNPQEIPLDNLTFRIEKRLFDILFSLGVIVFIFSWLFPIISILIKLNSRGPVFFVQQRTGINNKTFKCYKFRTMTVNSDADSKQAQVNDARITSIGNFLRKTNIDELPQFINVLLGNMSVVGPRPHMLKHTEQYSALIEHYKVRHFVKPGITGWAQVNGYRGLTDELWKMQKRVEFDMEYLENWSFIWDIRIIYMTVLGKNAYKNAG